MIGILLALPLVSVSILAWTHANPFNGASFALVAIALLVIAGRFSREAVEIAPARVAVPGALLIGFGWVYPHFLQNASPLDYLYAAPTGLIPCPTLSIVIGFTLVLGGLRSRSWCLVLAIMGLFYGIFGAVRLGVGIDWILALGALGMTYVAACGFRRRHNGTWLVRSVAMTNPTSGRLVGALVCGVAALFGLLTLFAGGRVLLGADPGYVVYLPLLVFNTGMGLVYLAVALIGWRDPVHGRGGAALVFGLNLLVLVGIFILHSSGAAIAADSLRAMTLRTVVWLVLLAGFWWLARKARK